MPLDERNDAYQAIVSEDITMSHSDSTEEGFQHTVIKNLPTPMGTPILSLGSMDSQSHFSRDDSQDAQLCQRCNELDFEDRINPTVEASFALDIDRRALGFACPLCKLLGTVYRANDPSYFKIHWPSGSEQTLKVKLKDDAPASGLETYEFSVNHSYSDGRGEESSLDPAKINYEVLRTKFEYCKAHHTDTFWGPEWSKHPETAKDACCPKRVTVENLRVFNCDTKLVEEATVETKYAALSYVWGNPGTRDQYPQTIFDACKVAQIFGLKYIWIDQLCIDQEGSHKMQQIRHMHDIYSNAELTIIAAAGHNSAYGIPAVNENSRRELIEFKIGSLRFVGINPSPGKIIKETTWAKRAWTYQEEMFSNRLLVFTDHGAWFACRRIAPEYGWEHLDPYDDQTWDWEVIADRSHEHYYYRGTESGFPRNISDMIEDFSGRALTYETDIINACSGCLGRLEQAAPPVHHLWGSPIPLYLPDRPHHGSLDGFIRGLWWFPRGGFNSLKRRVGFPSWSWTGWIGVVKMKAYTRYGFHWVSKAPTEVSVALELTTGKRLDWLELEKRLFLKDQPELISHFIILDAWTVSMRLELCQGVGEPGPVVRAVAKATSGEEVICTFDLLGEENPDSSKERITLLYKDVFTGTFLRPLSDNWQVLMLTMRSGDCHVRVGYVSMATIYVRDDSGKISGPIHDLDMKSLQLERKKIRLG